MRVYGWAALIGLLASISTQTAFAGVADYSTVREQFIQTLSPVLRDVSGLGLEVRLDDEFPRYAGGVDIENGKYVITMGNELELEPKMTPTAYLATLCHEAGHYLGGEPRQKLRPDKPWSSIEPQADYYAATECLSKIFFRFPDPVGVDYPVSQKVRNRCAESYADPEQQRICRRVAFAGMEAMTYISSIYDLFPNGRPAPAEYDRTEVAGKNVGFEYPLPQCRLDTYIAGALGEPRPACWYLGAPN